MKIILIEDNEYYIEMLLPIISYDLAQYGYVEERDLICLGKYYRQIKEQLMNYMPDSDELTIFIVDGHINYNEETKGDFGNGFELIGKWLDGYDRKHRMQNNFIGLNHFKNIHIFLNANCERYSDKFGLCEWLKNKCRHLGINLTEASKNNPSKLFLEIKNLLI
jgi:hypothetical protein